MIKPGSIRILGRDDTRYVIEFFDEGPRELLVSHVVAKIISAAIEQGKKELRQEIKKSLEG